MRGRATGKQSRLKARIVKSPLSLGGTYYRVLASCRFRPFHPGDTAFNVPYLDRQALYL